MDHTSTLYNVIINVTQGPKTRHLSFLTFLLNHILHCICFIILFFLQNQNISFLTEVILVWLEQSKKWKNRIKFLRFLCYFNPLQSSLPYSEIIPCNKGLHSVSNKTNRIKIRLQLFKLWQIHRHQLNWRIVNSKPLSPIFACISVCNSRQTTSFGPLRHIY